MMEGIAGLLGQSLAIAGLVAFWFMLALYLIALAQRNASSADIGWGPGFVLVALAVLWWHAPSGVRPTLMAVLVMVWGLRLAVHVILRGWGVAEDWRLTRIRAQGVAWWPLKMFLQLFVLRGVLMVVVGLPLIWVMTYGGGPLVWSDVVGFAVWCIGFGIELVADYQLVRFRKHPVNAGKLLRSGLWKFSRHPNYVGEALLWWGLWIIALPTPWGWFSLLGPLTMTALLWKISGVPVMESHQQAHPQFRMYAKTTSAFVPWVSLKKKKTG